MALAGESAGREYERRRRRDFSRVFFVVLTPVVVYGLVQAGAWAVNQWLVPWIFRQLGAEGPQEVLDSRTARGVGIVLATMATLRMATDLWGARRTTESWRKGHEGEVMTGQALDALPHDYTALHDLRMPGSRENIDHVVIGATGVFTVETKNYSSDVIIRRGVARHARWSMDTVVEQANRQANAVRAALSCEVRAIVCVQGGRVRLEGWFTKPLVDGVRFCSGPRLVEVITGGHRELRRQEIGQLTALAERRLGRAPRAWR